MVETTPCQPAAAFITGKPTRLYKKAGPFCFSIDPSDINIYFTDLISRTVICQNHFHRCRYKSMKDIRIGFFLFSEQQILPDNYIGSP